MFVSRLLFFEMFESIFGHVDVRVNIDTDHTSNKGRIRLEQLLVPHDSSVIDNYGGPLAFLEQSSIV